MKTNLLLLVAVTATSLLFAAESGQPPAGSSTGSLNVLSERSQADRATPCCAAGEKTAVAPCCAAEKPASAVASPCCAELKPAAPAPCCAEAKPDATAAELPNRPAVSLPNRPAVSLPNRSLYQLDATFTDDGGKNVTLVALRGQPVIVAMFFAQCEYACPMLVSDIQRVRAGLSDEVRARTRIVLVSFDTARDTPAALKAYRARVGLDANWTLLRGEAAAVQDLAMLLGVKFKQDDRGQFAHSNLMTVLNAGGEVVHQRPGLQGDVSETSRAVTLAAK